MNLVFSLTGTTTDNCDVTVKSGTAVAAMLSTYTYVSSLTAEVTSLSPTRGGTGGGTSVTITGTGFG